jgi:hypothetical protein
MFSSSDAKQMITLEIKIFNETPNILIDFDQLRNPELNYDPLRHCAGKAGMFKIFKRVFHCLICDCSSRIVAIA